MTGLNQQGLPEGYQFREDWELSPRQVRALLDRNEPDLLLIDCRTTAERELVCIPDSLHVPLQTLDRCLDELAECKNRKIVVYCHHGVRSLRMAAMLRAYGFGDVKSMAGGIDLWAIDIDRGMVRY